MKSAYRFAMETLIGNLEFRVPGYRPQYYLIMELQVSSDNITSEWQVRCESRE